MTSTKVQDGDLPGLEHLISVCLSHHLKVALPSPPGADQCPKDNLLGQPFDPILSAMLSRSNGGVLRDLRLLPITHAAGSLDSHNERWREHEKGIRDIMIYGQFDGFAYYLATVPSLADANGIQPVVYMDAYEGINLLPIASSVDRAFDLYAHYLEALASRVDELSRFVGPTDYHFPYDVSEFAARDKPFVQMLERNRFDSFLTRDRENTAWLEKVLHAAQGRA